MGEEDEVGRDDVTWQHEMDSDSRIQCGHYGSNIMLERRRAEIVGHTVILFIHDRSLFK